MRLSVYDPKGEMFEVLPDLAKKLVINDGWSLEPPASLPLFAPYVAPEVTENAPIETVEAAPAVDLNPSLTQ